MERLAAFFRGFVMNEISLGMDLAAIFLTANYLLHLIFRTFNSGDGETAWLHALRFEKRSLLNQRIYAREADGAC